MGRVLTRNGHVVTRNGHVLVVKSDPPVAALHVQGESTMSEGQPLLTDDGTPALSPGGTPILQSGSAPAIFAPATTERLTGETVPEDSPRLIPARFESEALNAALRGVHVPGCSEAKHVHFKFDQHVPAAHKQHHAQRAFIGGCSCLQHVRIVAGALPDGTGFQLMVQAVAREHKSNANAQPLAVLWRGEKLEGADGIGIYRRVDGLAQGPDTITVNRWESK